MSEYYILNTGDNTTWGVQVHLTSPLWDTSVPIGPAEEAAYWAGQLQGKYPDICPINSCKWVSESYMGFVTHLNDHHHWSFEEIADFIEKNGYDIVVANQEKEEPHGDGNTNG